MSCTNPVTVLPAALAARGETIAQALAASVLNGVGQFCTCPGLLVAVAGPGFDAFRNRLAAVLGEAAAAPMLGGRLASGYRSGLARWTVAGARAVFPPRDAPDRCAAPALLEVPAAGFLAAPPLREETFGPATLLVACADEAERRAVLAALPGQLTATLWLDADDQELAAALVPVLGERAGRLLFNGVPTGVEVGPRHGPRRALARHQRGPGHLGGHPGHRPLGPAGVLPGRAGGAAAAGTPGRQPPGALAPAGGHGADPAAPPRALGGVPGRAPGTPAPGRSVVRLAGGTPGRPRAAEAQGLERLEALMNMGFPSAPDRLN